MQQTLHTSALRDGQFKRCQPHYVAKRMLMGLKSSRMPKQINKIKQCENIVQRVILAYQYMQSET